MIKSYISGIGNSLPKYRITQSRIAQISEELFSDPSKHKNLIRKFHEKSGISNRYSVLSDNGTESTSFQSFYQVDVQTMTSTRMKIYASESVALAEKSSQEALGVAGVSPDEIDWLITVSCTGFEAPGLDVKMIQTLNLRPQVKRTHVGFMGCHGLFNGLQVAAAAIRSGGARNVLVVSVELCSLHFNPNGTADQLIANALFADGSSAVVLSSQPKTKYDYEYRSSASLLIPDTVDYMTWNIGDYGFEMTLSPKVPHVIQMELSQWIENWMNQEGIEAGEKHWAIHPGGPKILNSVQEALSLADETIRISTEVLRDHGNMSSATVGFILKKIMEQNKRAPIIGMGFGPGLIAEGFLLI